MGASRGGGLGPGVTIGSAGSGATAGAGSTPDDGGDATDRDPDRRTPDARRPGRDILGEDAPYLRRAAGSVPEDPIVALRSAAGRLRAVADDLEAISRSLRDRAEADRTTANIVTDAVTHLRLTAEALEFAAS